MNSSLKKLVDAGTISSISFKIVASILIGILITLLVIVGMWFLIEGMFMMVDLVLALTGSTFVAAFSPLVLMLIVLFSIAAWAMLDG